VPLDLAGDGEWFAMKTYAIVPARGGSKGIPKKNLQPVGGRSLIARCVSAAKAATGIEATFVSTDDEEIAASAELVGARIIRRPDDISGDTASSEAALLHACDVWKAAGELPDVIVFLQATSPFILGSDLDNALRRLSECEADVVVSVAQYHRFQWQMDASGLLTAVGHDQHRRPRRQELANRYVETGAFYLMRTRGFMESRFRFFGKVVGCETDVSRMMEIDDPMDLEFARAAAPLLDERAISELLPDQVDAVVFDFDGVMTDDTVYVDETGRETVRASRRDGMGIARLRDSGIPCLVLSKERNPVVARRCEKLRIECAHGVDDKLPALQAWLQSKGARLSHTVYVGNDINDIACMDACGFAVAVADAEPHAKRAANWVCGKAGGQGAVREVCEAVVAHARRGSGQ